jgi:ribonuclease Z
MGGHSNWIFSPEYDFMIDAGEGAASSVGIGRLAALKNLFITHPHWDHVAGLFQILNLRRRQDLRIPMSIWHPPSKKLENIRKIIGAGYNWNVVSPGERVRISEKLIIEPFRVKHRESYALGFKCWESRFRRKAEYEKFSSSEISNMIQTHRIANKKPPEINEPYEAHIFTHTGDTEPLDPALLGSPEILLHDSTYLPGMEAEAIKKGHSTLGHALEAKRATGARALVALHLSPQHRHQLPVMKDVIIPPPTLFTTKFTVEKTGIRLDPSDQQQRNLSRRKETRCDPESVKKQQEDLPDR